MSASAYSARSASISSRSEMERSRLIASTRPRRRDPPDSLAPTLIWPRDREERASPLPPGPTQASASFTLRGAPLHVENGRPDRPPSLARRVMERVFAAAFDRFTVQQGVHIRHHAVEAFKIGPTTTGKEVINLRTTHGRRLPSSAGRMWAFSAPPNRVLGALLRPGGPRTRPESSRQRAAWSHRIGWLRASPCAESAWPPPSWLVEREAPR